MEWWQWVLIVIGVLVVGIGGVVGGIYLGILWFFEIITGGKR